MLAPERDHDYKTFCHNRSSLPVPSKVRFGIWPESLCLSEFVDVRIWSPYFYHIPTLLSYDQAELLVNADPTDHPRLHCVSWNPEPEETPESSSFSMTDKIG